MESLWNGVNCDSAGAADNLARVASVAAAHTTVTSQIDLAIEERTALLS